MYDNIVYCIASGNIPPFIYQKSSIDYLKVLSRFKDGKIIVERFNSPNLLKCFEEYKIGDFALIKIKKCINENGTISFLHSYKNFVRIEPIRVYK